MFRAADGTILVNKKYNVLSDPSTGGTNNDNQKYVEAPKSVCLYVKAPIKECLFWVNVLFQNEAYYFYFIAPSILQISRLGV